MSTNKPSKQSVNALGACAAALVLLVPPVANAQDASAQDANLQDADVKDATRQGPGEQAEPEPAETSVAQSRQPQPRLHHAPPTVAADGKDLSIRADIMQPHLVRQAWLLYRGSSGRLEQVPFRRASEGPWVAVVPAHRVQAPALHYAIELELPDGRRRAVFASRRSMFRVAVPPEFDDLREKALLERLEGRRSEVYVSSEYVLFGSTDAELIDSTTGATSVEGIQDRYYRIESGYTYRPLGTVAEFSIRLGVVRGRSVVPGETDASEFDVGLNYGSPRVRFRIDDSLHVETELLTSVTEVGFSLGAGGAVLVGDPYGSRLTFGFESVQTFGTRAYTRMDIVATDRITVAPVIEVTDMPHADRYGVRLLSEVGVDAGAGFRVAARGGYQARTFTSGGPSVGATMSYAF